MIPEVDAWSAWTPVEVSTRLAHVAVPWCVVGGWAIDLFLGTESREHEDLEIEVPRAEFDEIRDALSGFEIYVAAEGGVTHLLRSDPPPEDVHQMWVLDVAAEVWRVDVMLAPGDRATWKFRRNPVTAAPRLEMVRRSGDGVPYLVPTAVLLFKARLGRPKDEADFDACVPRLGPTERAWLAEALRSEHPGHAWLARLQ